MRRSWFLVLFLLLLEMVVSGGFGAGQGASSSMEMARSSEAYVTLLYGDEFLLGVRVLGKSIRNTMTTKDMVVLVSDGVSDYAQRLLKADGWIVEHISLLSNPNHVRPKRFWGVYTKLKIFNLTRYRKVVYLDADTIVLKSIEDLFQCGKFCANLKHSERLNSGVMVVEPSEYVFKDMMAKVNSLYSYTGGDQGFLNSYYSDFANAHIYEPNSSSGAVISGPVPEMERLSTLYNADVGLYMLANKWMVDEKELRVIHYTLGPLKPWDWWTAWLLKPVDVWQDIREQLEESLPGTGGGSNPNERLLIQFLFAFPVLALILGYYWSCTQANKEFLSAFRRTSLFGYARRIYHKYKASSGLPSYNGISGAAPTSLNSNIQNAKDGDSKLPSYLGAISIFSCFSAALASFFLAFCFVPRQVAPWTGLLLMYEWTFTTFFFTFGGYLHLVYKWGRSSSNQEVAILNNSYAADYDFGKGRHRQASTCDSRTCFYGIGMALLAILVPWLPCFLGITALFTRLGLMVAGGIILSSFMTYASEHLAARAFLRGLEDQREQPKTRSNICFLY